MGKVQVLAVLSMDGCLASELYGKSYMEQHLDSYGITKIRENALYHITPDYSISMLEEWRKNGTSSCYLAEASPEKIDYINGLLRMQVVDEIILYTVPSIVGTANHFFRTVLKPTLWTLVSQKKYPNGVTCHIYQRMASDKADLKKLTIRLLKYRK